jgi:hypothetical protein
MDENVKRLAHRERLALGGDAMTGPASTYGAQIMSPIITNRPAIDSMLGDIAFSCGRFLEMMRKNLMDGKIPDRQERRDFRETCETVLRQAKTEIELEKHADTRQGRMKPEELHEIIQTALSLARVDQTVIDTVHEALGLSQTTSKLPLQMSASV